MILKSPVPVDLDQITQPKHTYFVSGPKGCRTIRTTSGKAAARQYVGHNYVCWLDTLAFGIDLWEDEAYGFTFSIDREGEA